MIVSLSEFKKFIKQDDTTQDIPLLEALQRAQDEAELICDRKFDRQEFTEYHQGNNTSELLLKNYPIREIESIHDDVALVFDSDNLIDTDEYQIESEWGIVSLINLVFIKPVTPIRNVRVIYTAGYTKKNAPRALKLAIMKLAASDFMESGAYFNAVTQDQEGADKPDELRKEGEELLEKFKRIR